MFDPTSLNGNPEEIARYCMWCRLVPGWENLTKSQKNGRRMCHRKQAPSEEDYEKANQMIDTNFVTLNVTPKITKKKSPDRFGRVEMGTVVEATTWVIVDVDTPFTSNSFVSLLDQDEVVSLRKGAKYPAFSNKEEETMNTNETETQRRYLANRLYNIFGDKDTELHKAFHLAYEEPATMAEFVQRIRDGKFKLPTDEELKAQAKYGGDYYDSYGAIHLFNWTMEEPDQKGYNAAHAELRKAKTEAEDIIKVMPVEQGLEALKAFEAKTFH